MNIQMESILVLLSFIHDFQLKKLSCSVRRVIIPDMTENATLTQISQGRNRRGGRTDDEDPEADCLGCLVREDDG